MGWEFAWGEFSVEKEVSRGELSRGTFPQGEIFQNSYTKFYLFCLTSSLVTRIYTWKCPGELSEGNYQWAWNCLGDFWGDEGFFWQKYPIGSGFLARIFQRGESSAWFEILSEIPKIEVFQLIVRSNIKPWNEHEIILYMAILNFWFCFSVYNSNGP